MKNRIKELRNEKGLTLKQLSKEVNIPSATLSRYENGTNLPKSDALSSLSSLFLVSIDYLTGKSDSRSGYDEHWDDLSKKINSQEVNPNLKLGKKNTGYNIDKTNNQSDNNIEPGRTNSSDEIQTQINHAVNMLEYNGSPDLQAIKNIDSSLRDLGNQIDTYYVDPKKWNNAPTLNDSNIHIIPRNGKISDYFYDDMNKEINLKIKNIIKKSRNDIRELANEYHLHDTHE